MIVPDFKWRDPREAPFPHVRASNVVSEALAEATLDWLDHGAPWSLTRAAFYEQYEFSLLDAQLPAVITQLASAYFISAVARELEETLGAGPLELVDVNVHRLVAGMTIRLHNDFLGTDEESHRMLIQLNRGWASEKGGLLMLFEDDRPESLTDVVPPDHRSAFGFEISPRSYHAVSTVHAGMRDTLVYTFRRPS